MDKIETKSIINKELELILVNAKNKTTTITVEVKDNK
jgi:hypothetical protein